MKPFSHPAFVPWRFYFVIAIIFLIVFGLIARLVDLTVINHRFLQREGDARSVRIVTEPVFRGMILDREGYPLAISTTVYSVWINPKEFLIGPIELKKLSERMGMSVAAILKLSKEQHRQFVYLKRNLPPLIAEKIKSLNITGLHLEQEYKRFYPEGEVTAHVVGLTNIDDHGQEGMELAYDQWLTGDAGKKQVIKDRMGRVVTEIKELREKKLANNLTLSINHRLQYVAYRELMKGVEENQAESGSVVVLDVKTGEILAMVNQPSFNPNKPSVKNSGNFRNRAVTDVFEPGSTIKAFSVASALASGRFNADSVIDTYPGWMRVGHHVVRDEHNKKALNVAQILELSSNVGITRIILSLPPNNLWKLLHNVGFGEATQINFPGERSGQLFFRDKWDPFALATLSFGYGLSVTTLQLARAYAVLANDGIKIPLTLLRIDQPPQGVRVIDSKVANAMLALLEKVTTEKEGTGKQASVPGYRVAGKTGTARIASGGGYLLHHHIASFVGIAPVNHPRLVVAVVIRNPEGKKYYGGDVSAPVFEKIMEDALRTLNIPPE